jgi:hypothetical protein
VVAVNYWYDMHYGQAYAYWKVGGMNIIRGDSRRSNGILRKHHKKQAGKMPGLAGAPCQVGLIPTSASCCSLFLT